MQEPAEVAGRAVHPVAAAEQPEPGAVLVLHGEVVAHRRLLRRPAPPLAGMRSGPSARQTRCRRRRQVKATGGLSGSRAMASTGCGGSSSRTGRGRLAARTPPGVRTIGATAATARSGTSLSTATARQTEPAPSRFSIRSTSAAMSASRLSRAIEISGALAVRDRLGQGHAQLHRLHARAGSTSSSRSLSSRPRWAGWRDGAAVPMRTARTDPSMRSKIRSSRRAPCAGRLQPGADRHQQRIDDLDKSLGGQQRLHEGQPGRDRFLRQRRPDRLERAPGRLIEPQQRVPAEPPRQRRAWHLGQLGNPIETEAPQRGHGLLGQAQGADRQRGDRPLLCAGRDHRCRAPRRNAPRRAPRRACRRWRPAPAGPAAKPVQQIGEQPLSPPYRWAQPVMSSQIPSGGSAAVSGV